MSDAPTPSPLPSEPRWGDPLSTISAERQTKLRQRAQAQRKWVATAPDGERDLDQSAFKHIFLTGADVFFLAADALVGPDDDLEAAITRLHAVKMGDRSTWVDLSTLHLEGAILGTTKLSSSHRSIDRDLKQAFHLLQEGFPRRARWLRRLRRARWLRRLRRARWLRWLRQTRRTRQVRQDGLDELLSHTASLAASQLRQLPREKLEILEDLEDDLEGFDFRASLEAYVAGAAILGVAGLQGAALRGAHLETLYCQLLA